MTPIFTPAYANPPAALSALSLDTLREVGNIGTGYALTALATLQNQGVAMALPKVGLVSLADFADLCDCPDSLSVCVYMPVQGDAPGHVAFLLPLPNALALADRIQGQPPGTTEELDTLTVSVLMEVGNILASSYLIAIGELTGLCLESSPPALAADQTVALLSSVAALCAVQADHALTIVTHIAPDAEATTVLPADGGVGSGVFIYIPEPESLPILLQALLGGAG